MRKYDVDIILGLFDLVGLFCLYEEMALQTKWFHTISWWAARHQVLRWAIIAAFLGAGIVGAIWFHGHACTGCIPQ